MAGQRDLSLATTEFDLMVSYRTGLSAAISLTPYLAARYALLSAHTSPMLFGADAAATPAQLGARTAAFRPIGLRGAVAGNRRRPHHGGLPAPQGSAPKTPAFP